MDKCKSILVGIILCVIILVAIIIIRQKREILNVAIFDIADETYLMRVYEDGKLRVCTGERKDENIYNAIYIKNLVTDVTIEMTDEEMSLIKSYIMDIDSQKFLKNEPIIYGPPNLWITTKKTKYKYYYLFDNNESIELLVEELLKISSLDVKETVPIRY